MGDIHLADLLGEEVHVVEAVVVTSKLAWHGVEILRPRGEDEEGAFSASEEALTFGLLRDGFLLEVDEGEAGVDGNVLHVTLARGNARGDKDDIVLGSFDPCLAITLPCLGVGVGDLGARAGWIGKGGVAILEALVEGELLHTGEAMAEDLHLQRFAQQQEVAEG